MFFWFRISQNYVIKLNSEHKYDFCFSSQVRLLTEGRCTNGTETIPLVQVRNVIDFMPQLKYMLSGMMGSDVGSKRQRNS